MPVKCLQDEGTPGLALKKELLLTHRKLKYKAWIQWRVDGSYG